MLPEKLPTKYWWEYLAGGDVDLNHHSINNLLLTNASKFKIQGSYAVKPNRANQGVAVDASGNFYVFSHDAYDEERNTITKYNSSWEYVSEAVNCLAAWKFSEGSVIDGVLYVALRKSDYSASAIAEYNLSLEYQDIHDTEGGCAENIQKYDGDFWIIQGGHGAKPATIARYNASWEYQSTYDLVHGYEGFVWHDDKIYCNRGGGMDIYTFSGSAFTRIEAYIPTPADEGFDLAGADWYFAGSSHDNVWKASLEKNTLDFFTDIPLLYGNPIQLLNTFRDTVTTRSLWIPASQYEISRGTPSQNVIGDRYDKISYWAFDDSTEEGVCRSIVFPPSLTGSDIEAYVYFSMDTATEGNVYLGFTTTFIDEGGDLGKTRQTSYSTIEVPGVARTLGVLGPLAISVGNVIKRVPALNRHAVWRFGPSENDTATGDCFFIGVLFTWRADVRSGM